MTVWRKIKALVDHVLGEDERAGNLRGDELRLAAAALLIHASIIDGHVDPEETKALKALLQSRFAIDDDELRKTLKEAEAWEHELGRPLSFHQRAVPRSRPGRSPAYRRDAVGDRSVGRRAA